MQPEAGNFIESQLRKLEMDLLRPEVRRNPEMLASLLAEEFREFGSSGRIYTRDEIVNLLSAESPWTFCITDFSVMMLSAGAALVTYQASRQSESLPQASKSLRSSLWVLREDRWRMLFHQGTKISD
jgi:hypothetical protein